MTIFYNVIPFPTPPRIADILDATEPDMDLQLWIAAQREESSSRFHTFARRQSATIFIEYVDGAEHTVRVLPYDDPELCVEILTQMELHVDSTIIATVGARLADNRIGTHKFRTPTRADLDRVIHALLPKDEDVSFRAFRMILWECEDRIVTGACNLLVTLLARQTNPSRYAERVLVVLARAIVHPRTMDPGEVEVAARRVFQICGTV